MGFPTFGAIAVGLGVALGLGLATLACGSSTSNVDGCVPTSSIVATGRLGVDRSSAPGVDVVTTYVLSTVQAADLFNSGALTVIAGEADGGAGTLDPHDPVVLVKMDPSTDQPGTYGLDAVHAQIAYCPTSDAKLVLANGALTGCAPSGTPVTEALTGTLTVTSASDKSLTVAIPPGHHDIALVAQYGSQTQQCN